MMAWWALSKIIAEWLISELVAETLDAETDAAVSRWMTDEWFGQRGAGVGNCSTRQWTETYNQYTGDLEYDLR